MHKILLSSLCIVLFFLQENVTLINEINDLRRELKLTRTQVNDLEATLGTTRNKNGQNNKGAVRRGSSMGECV